MNQKILWGIAVVALILGGWTSFRLLPISIDNGQLGTATGNLLAEQYLPYVLYNQGYNSAKSITTSDTVTAADVSVTDDLTVTDDVTVNGGAFTLTTSNTATSTAIIGCIQQYATSTATAVRMEFHASSSLANSTNGATDGLVVWKYGSCPI